MTKNDSGGRITSLHARAVILAVVSTLALLIESGAVITDTATFEIVGNIEGIAITPPPMINTLNFAPGQNHIAETLHVDSKVPWGLNVRSDTDDGRMQEYDGTQYVDDGLILNQQMHVVCSGVDVPLTGTDQSLIPYSNNNPETPTDYSITLSQDIIQPPDERVTSPNRYHIVIIFTGFTGY